MASSSEAPNGNGGQNGGRHPSQSDIEISESVPGAEKIPPGEHSPLLHSSPARGLNEQQKLIITVISVVAVLVANVSFLGWVAPPGGPHPYWENCLYKTQAAFLVLNGLAFLFALGSTGVVIVVPWLYPTDEHKPAVNWWIGTGLILLVISIICFTLAFVVAGLVTEGYAGPDTSCGVLPCDKGGILCGPSEDGSMAAVLSLNGVRGECFYVSQIVNGTSLSQQSHSLVLYRNSSSAGRIISGQGASIDESGCFLVAQQILGLKDMVKFSSQSNRILCTVAPMQGDSETAVGGKLNFEEALVDLTSNLWIRPGEFLGSELYYLQLPSGAGSGCNASQTWCACSGEMLGHQSDLMFVTYASPKQSVQPRVYLASIADSGNSTSEHLKSGGLDSGDVSAVFGQGMILYSPPVFFRSQVAVYDELKYRCSSSFDTARPTLCAFSEEARGSSPKWYKPVTSPKGVQFYERQCGVKPVNVPSDMGSGCGGLAVGDDGKYILIGELSDFGSDVVLDDNFISDNGKQTSYLTFTVLGIAFGLYLIILVFVILARHGWI